MRAHDVQHFTEDGTWVKPPGARRVDVTLKGGDGARVAAGPAALTVERIAGACGAVVSTQTFDASSLPDLVPVEVGQPGGYAVITTRLG